MPRAAYDQSYDWFLSLTDKSNISQYRCSDRRRKTLTTRLLSPLWELAANYIPPTVAPNVITLAGFMCNLQVSLLVALIHEKQKGHVGNGLSQILHTYTYVRDAY